MFPLHCSREYCVCVVCIKLTGIQGGRSDSRSRSNRGRSYTNRVESENTGNNTIDTVEATVMPLDSTVFTVKRVNLFINDNSIAHKTQDYYANGSRDDHIILRRGFPITMQLLFSRDYIPNKDIVNLTFTVAGKFHLQRVLSSFLFFTRWPRLCIPVTMTHQVINLLLLLLVSPSSLTSLSVCLATFVRRRSTELFKENRSHRTSSFKQSKWSLFISIFSINIIIKWQHINQCN